MKNTRIKTLFDNLSQTLFTLLNFFTGRPFHKTDVCCGRLLVH